MSFQGLSGGMLQRRSILRGAGALSLGGMLGSGIAWSRPTAPLLMLLPSASHDALAIKLLLDAPPSAPPVLTIAGRPVPAARMDPDGYSWAFIQRGLDAGSTFELRLMDASGRALRDPWPLRTLPPPDSLPERFRILFFTCAGGGAGFLPIAFRRALLDRALSFAPDLAVANGDHVYWDLATVLKYRGTAKRRAEIANIYRKTAWIDEDLPFDSEPNRRALNTIVGQQIGALYEDRFASVPTIFVADDHDYFENDDAGSWGYAFPPRPFTYNLQRRAADMVYPVALGRPLLGGDEISGAVESIRVGKLLELNLFDCRRSVSFGKDAGTLSPAVENYLVRRLRLSDSMQLIHVPSNPMGWSAGKLGEWYGDPPSAKSYFDNDKGYWQQGWFDQHQRLVMALSAQPNRAAVSISGDIHASAGSVISRSGDLDLAANPIHTILPGPLGTADFGFPSSARGIAAFHPSALAVKDIAPMEERNGFTLVDVLADRMEVRQFRWRPPEPVQAISTLQPAHSYTIRRP
jgi:hypothetical protein